MDFADIGHFTGTSAAATLALLLAACHRDSPPSAARGDAGQAASSARSVERASPIADAGAPPSEAVVSGDGEGAEDAGASPAERTSTYFAALAKGRAQTRSGGYPDAIAAFTLALQARPGDAHALSERGYARVLAGEKSGAAGDFSEALGRSVDAKFAAQIYFNWGLAVAADDSEASRAYFAISNALVASPSVQAKIGARSRCAAIVRLHGEPLKAFSGFESLKEEIQPRLDLGSAKASVCVKDRGTGDTAIEADARHACDGPPPWMIEHGYMQYTAELDVLVPNGKDGLWLFEAGRYGQWPAHCEDSAPGQASIDGHLLSYDWTFTGVQSWADNQDESGCPVTVGETERHIFDLRTGRLVADVTTYVRTPNPSIKVKDDQVVLSGAGCDQVIVPTPAQ